MNAANLPGVMWYLEHEALGLVVWTGWPRVAPEIMHGDCLLLYELMVLLEFGISGFWVMKLSYCISSRAAWSERVHTDGQMGKTSCQRSSL